MDCTPYIGIFGFVKKRETLRTRGTLDIGEMINDEYRLKNQYSSVKSIKHGRHKK
jgi:hypothetical protein